MSPRAAALSVAVAALFWLPASAQNQVIAKLNYGNTNIRMNGFAGVGPTTSNTNNPTTYRWTGAGGVAASVTCRGTRDYGPIVSGPWQNVSNLVRTFFYASGSSLGVTTFTGLRAGEDYGIVIYGHDTSTNRQHPHHRGLGTNFVVQGASRTQRRLIFSSNGNSPPANELITWRLTATATSQGTLTISYDRIMNGVELTWLGTDAPTAAPTSAAPTPAPTNWFAHANFQDQATRIAALERVLANVSSLESVTAQLSARVTEIDTLRGQIAALNATVQTQAAVVGQVRAALLDVVDGMSRVGSWPAAPAPPSCSGASCRPAVTASGVGGADLTLRAPRGTIVFEGGTCGRIDPCQDRMATNQTLAIIMGALANLALV